MRFGSYVPRGEGLPQSQSRLLRNPLRPVNAPSQTPAESLQRRASVAKATSAHVDHLGSDLVSQEGATKRPVGRARATFTPQRKESLNGTLEPVADTSAHPAAQQPAIRRRSQYPWNANNSSVVIGTPPSTTGLKARPRPEAPPFALDCPSARKKVLPPRTRKMFEGRSMTTESEYAPQREKKKTFPDHYNKETTQPPIRPAAGSRVRPSTSDLLRFKTPRTKTPRAALQKRAMNNILAWSETPRAVQPQARPRAKPAPAPYDCPNATMFAPPSARRKSVHRTVQPSSHLSQGLIPKSARGAPKGTTGAAGGPRFIPRQRPAQQSSLSLGSFVPQSAQVKPGSRSHHVDPGNGVKAALNQDS